MFRRRRFPHPPGRGRQFGQQALRKAHYHMERREYAKAALIFERLGGQAVQRGLPRAPQLILQAARAHLKAGNFSQAEILLKQVLTRLAEQGRWPALQRLGNRAVDELRQNNQSEQADQLNEWLKATLPADLPNSPSPASKQLLPAKCPYCGGNVLPDQVEWQSDQVAICAYCGSPLHQN